MSEQKKGKFDRVFSGETMQRIAECLDGTDQAELNTRVATLVMESRGNVKRALEAVDHRAAEMERGAAQVRESCKQLLANEAAGRMCFNSLVADGNSLAELVAKLEAAETEMGALEGYLGVKDVV